MQIKIEIHSYIAGNCNTPLRVNKELIEIYKGTKGLDSNINSFNLIGIYRMLQEQQEHTLFSSVYRTFIKIDILWARKQASINLKEFQLHKICYTTIELNEKSILQRTWKSLNS